MVTLKEEIKRLRDASVFDNYEQEALYSEACREIRRYKKRPGVYVDVYPRLTLLDIHAVIAHLKAQGMDASYHRANFLLCRPRRIYINISATYGNESYSALRPIEMSENGANRSTSTPPTVVVPLADAV